MLVLVQAGISGCRRSEAEPGRGPAIGMELRRAAGGSVDPFSDKESRGVVIVFLGAECPISNRYVPELLRLRERFEKGRIRFWMVYADADLSREGARRHAEAFRLGADVLLDSGHGLVKRVGAKVTPEVAVFLADGRLVYRGRIDNRQADLSRARPEATERDLERVLEAVQRGDEIPFSEKPAVGCYIENP
jgi:hypothetical protein